MTDTDALGHRSRSRRPSRVAPRGTKGAALAPALRARRDRRRPSSWSGSCSPLLAPLTRALLARPRRRDACGCCRRRRSIGSAPTRSAAMCCRACSTARAISLFVGIIVVLLGAAVRHPGRRHRRLCGRPGREALMRFTDLVLCFPPIILAMAIAAALGIGTLNTMIAMLVVWWPKFARLARGLVLVQRGQEYVEAAHVIGYGPARVLVKHILPNALGSADRAGDARRRARDHRLRGPVVPRPRRGAADAGMGRHGVRRAASWSSSGGCATFPGLAIFTVVMGFNFLGDGIRDWLDPRARRR